MQYLCLTVPPAVRPTVLRQMDAGCLTCTQIRSRESGEGGQTDKSARELTQGPTLPGDPTQAVQI